MRKGHKGFKVGGEVRGVLRNVEGCSVAALAWLTGGAGRGREERAGETSPALYLLAGWACLMTCGVSG